MQLKTRDELDQYDKYICKTYKLKAGLVLEFSDACIKAGTSQAGQLSKMMRAYVEEIEGKKEEA